MSQGRSRDSPAESVEKIYVPQRKICSAGLRNTAPDLIFNNSTARSRPLVSPLESLVETEEKLRDGNHECEYRAIGM
jgi:hypothetical protein